MRASFPLFVLAITLAAACRDGRPNPVREAMAATSFSDVQRAVLLRFAAARTGAALLYELPTLDAVEWRLEAGDRPTQTVVGFASDDDLIYLVDDENDLVELDLTTGRARSVAEDVLLATLGPAGTPVVVREDSSVSHIEYRRPVPWNSRFSDLPSDIWGAMRNRVIGIVPIDSARALELLADGQQPVRQPLPAGPVAVARWGDVVAVAADSGVVVLDPADPTAARFTRLSPPPVLVAFSESAHRLYAFDGGGSVTALERFTLEPVDELTLPGAPAAIRADPRGRFLLARPAAGDSLWILDLVRWSLPGTLAAEWDAHLPTVAPDGTILFERDGELIAFSYDRLGVVGRTGELGDDRWLPLAWDPRRPTLQVTAASAQPSTSLDPSQRFYVQVSSTSNLDWAEDMAGNLRRAGIDASVLPPEGFETRYRVVLGPYPSRDAAEAIRRTLNMPSWIFVRDTTAKSP